MTDWKALAIAGKKQGEKAAKQASKAAAPQEELTPVPPSHPEFSKPELRESEPEPSSSSESSAEFVASNDAIRTAYSLLFGKSSRLDGVECARAIKKLPIKIKVKKGVRTVT